MTIDTSTFPQPYIPNKLPQPDILTIATTNPNFFTLLLNATSSISEFIGYLQNLPSQSILISSLTLQESVLSSSIEGTIATIEDVVNGEPESETIKNDIVEIQNYVNAIRFGYESLKSNEKIITQYLIRQLHVLLLENNVRGANKTPGAYKTEQNYIKNNTLGNFTPLPPLLTPEYMENLIDFINSDIPSKLMQVAIAHAQFEMIHPFKDGNGRVGRILIPLTLYAKDKIPAPIFYISRYFTQYNDEYKRTLSNLSKTTGADHITAWIEWISFFLNGVIQESKLHISTSTQIIELHKVMINEVNKTDMIPLVDHLFANLSITPKEAATAFNLPESSVYKELKRLAAKGYIKRIGTPRKTKYTFVKLMDILQ